MKRIFSIFEIGIANQTGDSARKIWMTNVLTAIAGINNSFYIVVYFSLGYWVSGAINCITLVLYELTFLWNFKKQYRLAKIWIFIVFILHITVLIFFEFSNNTGFHFYYFIVPALSFLIFEYEDKIDKFILSSVAFILFLTSELWISYEPYLNFSSDVERFLYLTSVILVFFIILLVIIAFTYYLKQHEKTRENLISELQKALSEVKTLKGFIPICSSCKKIRDDKGYWNQIESYIREHSEAEFSHGICPECSDTLYGDQEWYIKMKNEAS